MEDSKFARSNKAGFTLIELLYVMIVIMILLLIALPIYSSVVKRAKTVEAQQTLTEIQKLQVVYFFDNDSYSDDLSEIGFNTLLKYYSVNIVLNADGFIATAVGDIDDDGDVDVWTINEVKKLTHVNQD